MKLFEHIIFILNSIMLVKCQVTIFKSPLPLQQINGSPVVLHTQNSTTRHNDKNSCFEVPNEIKSCDSNLKGLLDLVVDQQDWDGTLSLGATLTTQKLILTLSSLTIREWPLKTIRLPLETLNDQCFGIRFQNHYPVLLCSSSRSNRNFWMNAIHEKILCEKNKGIHGYLPMTPQAEIKNQVVDDTNNKPSSGGINIHISRVENATTPELLINGHPIDVIIKEEKKEVQQLIQPSSSTDMNEDFLDTNNEERDETQPSTSLQPLPFDTLVALNESKAEKLLIPAQDSPPYGYKSLQSRDLHSNIMRHETLQPSSTVKRA